MSRRIVRRGESKGALTGVSEMGMSDSGISNTAWRSKGACQGLDAEIFYPDNDELADVAKAICDECQVRIACLTHALDNREHQGVWGGATAKERRRLLRQRRRSA